MPVELNILSTTVFEHVYFPQMYDDGTALILCDLFVYRIFWLF